jgi:hypothetical protein
MVAHFRAEYPLYELYRNSSLNSRELLKKIYPIRVENLELNDPKVLREYFTYWKEREAEWKGLVTDFNADQKKHRMINAINTSIADLLPFLNDINIKTKEMLSANDFDEIKIAIEKQISKSE